MLLVYRTPFVVVTISQLLDAPQAVTDTGRGTAPGKAVETFTATALTHGIPTRAALVRSLVAGVNTAIVVIAAFLERGSLDEPPLSLLGQAFALPVLFGVLSKAVAYRRAIAVFRRARTSHTGRDPVGGAVASARNAGSAKSLRRYGSTQSGPRPCPRSVLLPQA